MAEVFNAKIENRIRSPSKKLSANLKYYRRKIKRANSDKSVKRKKLRENVQKFYLNDSNSAFAPGINDTVTKKKMKMRKRFLLDTVQNLHRKFCE